jgi:hypothetical protein
MAKYVDGGYPLYILDDGTVFLCDKGMNHVDYWEETVCFAAARALGVSASEIANMPYCQKRARVVGDNLYCGDKLSKAVLKKINKLVGRELVLKYDDHETRCDISVRHLKGLRTQGR